MTDASPPGLSDAYHKARRSFGLYAGLLLAWELVGVTIGKKPWSSLDVTLRNTDAVQYVLVALVGYFAFRTTVEWLQCDANRRRTKPALSDFGLAWFIGIASLVLYGIQQASEFRLAQKLDDAASPELGLYFLLLAIVWIALLYFDDAGFLDRRRAFTMIAFGGVLGLSIYPGLLEVPNFVAWLMAVIMTSHSLTSVVYVLVMRRRSNPPSEDRDIAQDR